MSSRRSWLQNLGSGLSKAFSSDEEGYFFGLQLLIHAFGEDILRERLANVINDPSSELENTEAKRRYLKRVAGLLLDQEAYWSQAFWDYQTGATKADAEFETWSAELSASTATESEEMHVSVDGAYRLSNNKDYVAVTIILRLSAPFAPAEIDDENLYWQSRTIANLVRGLMRLDPETIIADGIFVTPGSSEDGLSEEDLLTGGWSYLRVLT